jgi:hypothetical protein
MLDDRWRRCRRRIHVGLQVNLYSIDGLMEPESTSIPPFDALIKAESQNFQTTTTALGETTGLVQDFEDLYQSLADFIRISAADGYTVEQAKVGGYVLLLLMKCRGDLLVGSLNLLRGYQGNSLRFLRAAIEACAFAARIKKHPHMADVWLNAVDSDADYEKYREKFGKNLFPADDPLLRQLYQTFDQCSRVIHNSAYSLAGSFSFRREGTWQHIEFKVFDLPEGPVLPAALYFTLDTHRRILTKFSQVLADNIKADLTAWQIRFDSVEANLDFHREKWKTVIPDPRTTP